MMADAFKQYCSKFFRISGLVFAEQMVGSHMIRQKTQGKRCNLQNHLDQALQGHTERFIELENLSKIIQILDLM